MNDMNFINDNWVRTDALFRTKNPTATANALIVIKQCYEEPVIDFV